MKSRLECLLARRHPVGSYLECHSVVQNEIQSDYFFKSSKLSSNLVTSLLGYLDFHKIISLDTVMRSELKVVTTMVLEQLGNCPE